MTLRYIFMVVLLLPVLLYYGNGYRVGCYQLGEHIFEGIIDQPVLAAGDTTNLNFVFYPLRDRPLTVHNSIHEQFDLYVSTSEYSAKAITMLKSIQATSAKKTRTYGVDRPLLVSVPLRSHAQGDGTVLLDFGEYGKIIADPGANIRMHAKFYPTMTCAYDSRESTRSNDVEFLVE